MSLRSLLRSIERIERNIAHYESEINDCRRAIDNIQSKIDATYECPVCRGETRLDDNNSGYCVSCSARFVWDEEAETVSWFDRADRPVIIEESQL